jgi:repressor LexA
MKATITHRQQAVLDYLADCVAASGLPPTVGELADAFDIHLSAARKHLQALAGKGLIALLPGKARGIRLCRPAWPASIGTAAMELPALVLPLVGRVAAGAPILSEGHIEARYAIDPALFRPRPDFLLRVEGESMIDAGILDGDLIAVHRTPVAEDGQVVVVRLEGEITVKRLRRLPARILLLPANPAYAPIEVPSDTTDFAIEGLYVGAIRRG